MCWWSSTKSYRWGVWRSSLIHHLTKPSKGRERINKSVEKECDNVEIMIIIISYERSSTKCEKCKITSWGGESTGWTCNLKRTFVFGSDSGAATTDCSEDFGVPVDVIFINASNETPSSLTIMMINNFLHNLSYLWCQRSPNSLNILWKFEGKNNLIYVVLRSQVWTSSYWKTTPSYFFRNSSSPWKMGCSIPVGSECSKGFFISVPLIAILFFSRNTLCAWFESENMRYGKTWGKTHLIWTPHSIAAFAKLLDASSVGGLGISGTPTKFMTTLPRMWHACLSVGDWFMQHTMHLLSSVRYWEPAGIDGPFLQLNTHKKHRFVDSTSGKKQCNLPMQDEDIIR